MGRILIILKKYDPRAFCALALGLNTIIYNYVLNLLVYVADLRRAFTGPLFLWFVF